MITLYAKSESRHGWPTLAEHTATVCEAVTCLLGQPGEPTRLAQSLLRLFKMPQADYEHLRANAMVAAALHDIGKANDGFQAAVGNPAFKKRCQEQAIRHEHLSALLVSGPAARDCLAANPSLDYPIVLSAVVTHHLKARFDGTNTEPGFADRLSDVDGCRVLSGGLANVVALAGESVRATDAELKRLAGPWTFSDTVAAAADRVKTQARRLRRDLQNDDARRRLLLAVRSVLIAADAAGSGLVREGRGVGEWIRSAFGGAPLTGEYIRREIIDRRIAQLKLAGRWNRSNGRNGWNDFQDAAACLGPRALLLAPCGAGKTLAAWRWIEAQLAQHPAARAIFLYPTRGTATEGFRDYVSWAPETDAALVSGSAAYDIEGLFENPSDADHGSDDPRSAKRFTTEREARLFALAQWPKRVLSATVDAFLGFMANQYGPICLLPLLSDSVVVIDEVHSFSPAMFSALRTFLAQFDLPVLCMSASLPAQRRNALAELGVEVFPRSTDDFADLQAAADHPRYRVCAPNVEGIESIVAKALGAGKKVLWVVNRVDECQRRYRRMVSEEPCAIPPNAPRTAVLCYHSRFKLCDRRRRHNEVIRTFKDVPRGVPALVVTTQVCEMSLDLDADVLVSEAAPVTSLIQRMGRCCREKNPADRIGEVYICDPPTPLPYDPDDVRRGLAFRDTLATQTAGVPDTRRGAVSQSDLSRELEAQVSQEEIERYSAFWESGFWASAQEQGFREGEEYTIDCVLDKDVDAYLDARANKRPDVQGYVVPVPRRRDIPFSADPRLRGLMIAPDSLYDPNVGYCKPEVPNAQDE